MSIFIYLNKICIMALLNIPLQDLDSIVTYHKLSAVKKSKLLRLISNYPLGTRPADFIDSICKNVKITSSDANDIFTLLMNLTISKLNVGDTEEDFLTNVKNSIKENAPHKYDLTMAMEVVEEILLNIDVNFTVTAQAISYYNNNNKVYYRSKIFHELRPIVIDGIYEGALCIHKLKISYREDDVEKEFYVALDGEDLIKLKESIQKSEKEFEAIKSKSELKIIDFSE